MKISSSTIKKILIFEIVFTLVFLELVELFKLPSVISFVLDLSNVIIFLFLFIKKNQRQFIKQAELSAPIKCFITLLIVLLLGDVVNMVSPLLVIWAIRNSFRFFLFFYACVIFLTKDDVKHIFSLLVWFQIPNLLVSFFQFFVLGKNWDNIGGLFGTESGCNAYSNVYFCIIFTYVLIRYMAKKTTLFSVVWVSASCLLLSAFGEIKIFYVEFIIIVLLTLLLSKPSIKKIGLLIICIFSLITGMYVLERVMPDAFQLLTNYDYFMEYNTEAIWGYNISRFGAFGEINKLFFHDNVLKIYLEWDLEIVSILA